MRSSHSGDLASAALSRRCRLAGPWRCRRLFLVEARRGSARLERGELKAKRGAPAAQARPGAARTHTPPRAGYAAAAGPALRRRGSITGPGHGQAARPGLSYAAVVGLATARPACVLLYVATCRLLPIQGARTRAARASPATRGSARTASSVPRSDATARSDATTCRRCPLHLFPRLLLCGHKAPATAARDARRVLGFLAVRLV